MAVSNKMRKTLEKRRKELSSKGGGKFKFVTFKEGTTRIRLLPVPADTEFAVEVTYFYPNQTVGSIISPATFGEPCALMETYERLKNSKKEEDKTAAKLIQPKRRYMVMGCKFQDEKGLNLDTETGAKLMLLTNQVYQDIIDLYLDEEEAGDMTDPIKGYDLKIKRTGSGQFDTEYNVIKCKNTKRPIQFKGQVFNPQEEVRKNTSTYEETQQILEQVLGSKLKTKTSSKKPLAKGKVKSKFKSKR